MFTEIIHHTIQTQSHLLLIKSCIYGDAFPRSNLVLPNFCKSTMPFLTRKGNELFRKWMVMLDGIYEI